MTDSRRKGKVGELEVARILRSHGWGFAERTSRGTSQNGKDFKNGPAGCTIDARRERRVPVTKAFYELKAEADPLDVPILVHRNDGNTEWLATMPLEELLPLLRLKEFG